MRVDDAVWASVRCAHEHSREPMTHVCKRFGVSTSAYYRKRNVEKWPKRPSAHKISSAQEGLAADGVRTERRNVAPPIDEAGAAPIEEVATSQKVPKRKLTERLYAAIDLELQQLESGSDNSQQFSVVEIERRTRTLMNMIRGMEKVLELDADRSKKKSGRRKRTKEGSAETSSTRQFASDDIDRMREDIATRLSRLHAQWANSSRSESARPKSD